MGGKQSTINHQDILNDSKVKIALKKINETITNIQMKAVQESIQNVKNNTNIMQEISLKKIKTSGDFKLTNINQSVDVKSKTKSIQTSDLNANLVKDIVSKIQSKLKNELTSAQNSKKKESEQIFGQAFKTIGKAMNAITGTSTNSNNSTRIRNILNVDNNTELVNKIEKNISTELVNKTVTAISTSLQGSQKINVEDVDAGGNVIIDNIDQEFKSEQIIEAIKKSGTSSEIMAKMSNVDVADLNNAIANSNKNEDITKGTIGDVGDAASKTIDSAGNAASKTINAAGNFISSVFSGGAMFFGVIGLLLLCFLYVFWDKIEPFINPFYIFKSNSKSKSNPNPKTNTNTNPNQNPNTNQDQKIKGGKINNINTMIIIFIFILSIIINKLCNLKERFFSKNNINIKSENKYLDSKLCLSNTNNSIFNISLVDKKNINIYKTINNKKYYVILDNNKIFFEEYNINNKRKYKFKFKKITDNTYKFNKGPFYLGFNNNCLVVVKKINAADFILY